VDHVVAAAVAQQVQKDPQPEHERRQDAPAPARRVERHARARGHDPHALVEIDLLAAVPLAQRQVGDLVAVGRQALGEVAIPALGAADGVGEQAVIDDADTHSGSIISRIRATFRPPGRYNRMTPRSARAPRRRA
jgi:hypothetical protein